MFLPSRSRILACCVSVTMLATQGVVAADKQQQVSGEQPELHDFHLATWVIIENKTIADVAKFAEKRAEHKEVAEFVGRITEMHRQLIAELHVPLADANEERTTTGNNSFRLDTMLLRIGQRLMEKDAIVVESDDDPEPLDLEAPEVVAETGDRRTVRPPEDDTYLDVEVNEEAALKAVLPVVEQRLPEILAMISGSSGSEQGLGLSFIELKRQIGEQHLQSVKAELEKAGSSEFDQSFLGFQLAAHLRAIDTMEVAKRHASDELTPILDANLEMLRRHLETARRLMGTIETR